MHKPSSLCFLCFTTKRRKSRLSILSITNDVPFRFITHQTRFRIHKRIPTRRYTSMQLYMYIYLFISIMRMHSLSLSLCAYKVHRAQPTVTNPLASTPWLAGFKLLSRFSLLPHFLWSRIAWKNATGIVRVEPDRRYILAFVIAQLFESW